MALHPDATNRSGLLLSTDWTETRRSSLGRDRIGSEIKPIDSVRSCAHDEGILQELSYWNAMADIDAYHASLEGHASRANHPPTLFEAETRCRYHLAGLIAEKADTLSSGKKPEFSVVTESVGRVHIECKHIADLLKPDDVKRVSVLWDLAEQIATMLVGVVPRGAIIQFEFNESTSTPSSLELATDAARNVQSIDMNSRESGDAARVFECAWGELRIRTRPGLFCGDGGARAQRWSREGIHPFDGYVISRRYIMPKIPRSDRVLILPEELIVAVRGVPDLKIDNLLKRQFEKAKVKIAGQNELMFAHMRLQVPPMLFDLPNVFELSSDSLRRVDGMNKAIDRIAGLVRLDDFPDAFAGYEVSTWTSKGTSEEEAGLVFVATVVENPKCAHAGALIAELRHRGLFMQSSVIEGDDA